MRPFFVESSLRQAAATSSVVFAVGKLRLHGWRRWAASSEPRPSTRGRAPRGCAHRRRPRQVAGSPSMPPPPALPRLRVVCTPPPPRGWASPPVDLVADPRTASARQGPPSICELQPAGLVPAASLAPPASLWLPPTQDQRPCRYLYMATDVAV
uniref:Uncharacterized protein n=1 Tax=Oryza rufipogon TaxID=4529 RepID=A0A0E0QHA7_ORYRU